MAYCYTDRANQANTISTKLAAISHVHKHQAGREIPTSHFLINAVKRGIQRETGTVQKPVRRPLTWTMLRTGHRALSSNHKDAVTWIGLSLSYFLFCRASELWAYNRTGLVHAEYCLIWSDVQWTRDGVIISDWKLATAVTVTFRASKGDQQRRGATVERTGYPMQLLQCLRQSVPAPPTAPLMSYMKSPVTTAVISRDEATEALRRMIDSIPSDYPAAEYALHSGRIGAATQLASQNASQQVIQAAGRWKQASSFAPYIRPNSGDAATISAALTA